MKYFILDIFININMIKHINTNAGENVVAVGLLLIYELKTHFKIVLQNENLMEICVRRNNLAV